MRVISTPGSATPTHKQPLRDYSRKVARFGTSTNARLTSRRTARRGWRLSILIIKRRYTLPTKITNMTLAEIIKEDGLYRSDKTKTGWIYEVREGTMWELKLTFTGYTHEIEREAPAQITDEYFELDYYKVESYEGAFKQRTILTAEHWKEIRAQVIKQADIRTQFDGFVTVDICSRGAAIDGDGNFLNPITITI